MKTCSVCKRILPKSEFNKRSKATDGLRSECRSCQRATSKTYYYEGGGQENKRIYYVKNRIRLLPKLRLRGGNTYYNPQKSPARKAVQRAIKSGALTRAPCCRDCNKICKTEAHHHNGYTKEHRLDVIWLCQECHSLADHPEFAQLMKKEN